MVCSVIENDKENEISLIKVCYIYNYIYIYIFFTC